MNLSQVDLQVASIGMLAGKFIIGLVFLAMSLLISKNALQ